LIVVPGAQFETLMARGKAAFNLSDRIRYSKRLASAPPATGFGAHYLRAAGVHYLPLAVACWSKSLDRLRMAVHFAIGRN